MKTLTIQQLIDELSKSNDKSKDVLCIRSSSEQSPMYEVIDIFMDLDSIVVLDIRLKHDD